MSNRPDPRAPHGAPSTRPVLAVLAVALATLIAACSSAAGQPATASGGTAGSGATAAPTLAPSLDPDAIDHPTGATDIVLRVGEEGGFMMAEAVMSRVPAFTLYGDGRVLIAQPAEAAKSEAGINGAPQVVLRQAHLTEDEVQAVLRNALVDGKVGVAKEEFPVFVMDVPTTVIELHAGGVDKRIKVAGLAMDPPPGPDAAVLGALAALVGRLESIPATEDYVAPADVAIINETDLQGVNPEAWPWPDLAPAAFPQPVANDPFGFRSHVLTGAQATAIGVDSGAFGPAHTFKGPDGKGYLVVTRPALPEEAAAAG